MADSAARVRVFSDDGKCVSDAVLMRRALEYVKAFDGVVAQHAQEPRLTEDAQMNEGELSGRLGLAGWPAVAEEAIIARDCLLAAHVGSRLHVCHVSTAGSVEIIRWAKSKGWNVTAEVCPHHLLLTDDLAATYDPIYKVNPPLRSSADVEALRAGLADGTIDVVATDHAPHPHEDKDCEWAAAAFGMLGLETALSIVQETMVDPGLLDWAGVADRMSDAPARIGRVADHGRPLEAGQPANLVLHDPSVRRVVDPTESASLSPQHAVRRAWSCPAGWWRRSSAAGPRCWTASCSDRGRAGPPRRAGRRRREPGGRADGRRARRPLPLRLPLPVVDVGAGRGRCGSGRGARGRPTTAACSAWRRPWRWSCAPSSPAPGWWRASTGCPRRGWAAWGARTSRGAEQLAVLMALGAGVATLAAAGRPGGLRRTRTSVLDAPGRGCRWSRPRWSSWCSRRSSRRRSGDRP